MEPQAQGNTEENTQDQQRIQSQDESSSDASSVKERAVEKKGGGINKYFILAGVLGLLIVGGIVYRVFLAPESARPVETGIERHITITTHANTWRFDPEFVEADRGDKIILTIINEDDYDHGFAIDAFGISQRMPALGTIQIEFVVTKAGDFPYYCSVSCGSGEVDGEDRGHFDQIGRVHVRSIISETVDYAPEEPAVDFAVETRKAAMIQEADRYAEKFGFTDDVKAVIDEGNLLWEQYVKENRFGIAEIKSLENIDFQAIYFKGDLSRISPFWILIDVITGEVIQENTANDGVDT